MKFRSKPVTIEADQWWKNGDHPLDKVGEDIQPAVGEDIQPAFGDEKIYQRIEGAVVRFFRHPSIAGSTACSDCGRTYHEHGWLDTAQGGHKVCPGDWIIPEPDRPGQYYPCKPDVFEARWEPADKPTAVRLFPIPPGTARVKCQRCPEMIYHVPTGNEDKTQPLSVEPELKVKKPTPQYVATGAKAPTSEEEGYGFSHFSNCPAAGSFRKGIVYIEVLIALVVVCILVLVFAGSFQEWRAGRACLKYGYPQSSGGSWVPAYCIKRVNQTDTVVPLKELEKQ